MRNLNRDFIEVAKKLHEVAATHGTFTETASQISVESINELNSFIDSNNINGVGIAYYGGVSRITFKGLVSDPDNGDIYLLETTYEMLKKYRNDAILWMQFRYELSNLLNEAGIETYSDGNYIRINLADSAQLQKMLEIVMEDMTFGVEFLAYGLSSYNRTFADYFAHYERNQRINGQNQSTEGLSKKIADRQAQELEPAQWMAIEDEIQKYQTQIGNHIVSRTWGWEIEAPNPGSGVRTPMGVEAGSDGSVESYETDTDGCECDCRSCTYHSCDCGNCNDYNDDPEHCNDSDCNNIVSYEFRTTGGITRALHPGLRMLLDQIKDTEKNETAGTHIHVFAKDLTAKQIGIVLAGYAITQRIWDVICGRNVNDDDGRCRTYANHIPAESISATLRTDTLYHVGKFTAINTHHAANERGTLEFRQMDCNFSFDRITFMAWMARGLIQTVKNGAQITDFFAVKNITDFVEIYAKYGFTFSEETAKVEDPYGSRYRQVTRTFQVA
jgi:hypothetical protein